MRTTIGITSWIELAIGSLVAGRRTLLTDIIFGFELLDESCLFSRIRLLENRTGQELGRFLEGSILGFIGMGGIVPDFAGTKIGAIDCELNLAEFCGMVPTTFGTLFDFLGLIIAKVTQCRSSILVYLDLA